MGHVPLSGVVRATTIGPDGTVYVGGTFTTAGGVVASRIAKWDPSVQAWEALGSGVARDFHTTVNALTSTSDGSIYVGGNFTSAGGTSANGIAKWNTATQSWEALGSELSGTVVALTATTDGSIYAGGYLQLHGVLTGVAKWDPSNKSWEALGSGLPGSVAALQATTDGSIYAGGSFTSTGSGTSANRIARWNPISETWEALGSGLNDTVYALTTATDGSIIVGGKFTSAGGSDANRIARWNPTSQTWAALGAGLNNRVYALTTAADGSIYVGGRFTTAGNNAAKHIANWNPASQVWDAPGSVFTNDVMALSTSPDGSIYAGSAVVRYTPAGLGKGVGLVAKWNAQDTDWQILDEKITGLTNSVNALVTTADGSIYAAGTFGIWSTPGDGLAPNRVARWNPNSQRWEDLGSGLNHQVRTMTGGTDGSLYVGGDFDTAGGISADGVAKWNSASQKWEALGRIAGGARYLTTGADGSIYAMGQYQFFRWNPNAKTWDAIGSSIGSGYALTAAADGSIYWTTRERRGEGDGFHGYVHKWNPASESWDTLGSQFSNVVLALATTADGSLYAGGFFNSVGGTSTNGVAKWNPDSQRWEAVGSAPGSVRALTIGADGALYAGGSLTSAGEISAIYLAKWTPATQTWEALGSGVNGQHVLALATAANGSIITAGSFSVAGNKPAAFVAKWNPKSNVAPTPNAGADQAVEASSANGAEITLDASSSFDNDNDDLSYSWSGPFDSKTGITATVTLPIGTTTVTLTVNDGTDSSTDTVDIAVSDTTPPGISVPDDVSKEATGTNTSLSAEQLGTAIAVDIVDGSFNATTDNSGPFTVGETTITWTAIDAAGNAGSATQTVTITDNEAPTVTAPANLNAEATSATTAVDLGTGSATDTVDGTLSATADQPGPYPVGVTTVTWSATDSAGNTGTAAQTVTIIDSSPPAVTAPANISSEAKGISTAIDLGTAIATDTVDGTLTATPDKPGPYPIGITTITWSASDRAGNTGTAIQTVTIADSGSPTVMAPANISTEATGSATSVTLGAATATDSVDGTLPVIPDPPGPFPVGTTTVTWSATDSAGNTGSATQTVTVNDGTAPVVSPPANISVVATGTTTSVSLGNATAIDIVDGALTATADNAGPYPVGTTTITWGAIDSAGNIGTANQTITITDSGSPVVTAPANVTANATGVSTPISLGSASATDAVDGVLTASPNNPGPYPVGTTTVTWTATDSAGNQGVATQSVRIVDSTPPVVTAPPNINTEATGLTTQLDPGTASATDAIAGVLTATADKTGPYPLGVTSVVWSATDRAGNTGTAVQTITITDSQAPVVTAPADVATEAAGITTSISLGSGQALDSVDGQSTATPDNPGPYPVGLTTIIWSATDTAGNTGTATQTVTITDTGPPLVSAPAGITAEAAGPTTAIVIGQASATDTVNGVILASPDNSGPFPAGLTTVTWTATDSSGNSGTATQTVNIVDSTAPVVIAPTSITAAATGATTAIGLGVASASDIVDGLLTAVPDNPGPYAAGTTIVTWSATDLSGNTGTATQSVTITDTRSPLVSAPPDITREAIGATTSIDLGTATVTDSVDGSLTATPDNPGPYPVGTNIVIWSATDSVGNTGTAAQLVTITDGASPIVTAPPNIRAQATGATTSINLGTASATDKVDGSLTAIPDNAGPYPPGSTVVTWSATDSVGNTGSAIQTVTITDSAAPIVTAPSNITVEATGVATVVSLGSATAVDTVDGSLSVSPNNTGPFAVGSTTVTWSATDSSGSTGTATQIVTIIDSRPPTVAAPAGIATTATGPATSVNLGNASAIDTVDGTLIATPDNPGPFQPGTTTITWSATDAAGNTGNATQTVALTDTRPPAVIAPADISAVATGATTAVALGHASAIDSVDGVLTAKPDDSGPYAVGDTDVTWSAADASGNTGYATQTITITDNGLPVVTAPPNILVEATGKTTPVDLVSAVASDAVDGVLVATPDKPGPYPVGTTMVTWHATDQAGNANKAIQTVTVIDSEPPTVTAPENITIESDTELTLINLGTPVAHDSVDGSLIPIANNNGPYQQGLSIITWSVTDSSGNTGTARQTVLITDSESTTVANLADDFSNKPAAGALSPLDYFGIALVALYFRRRVGQSRSS